MNRPLNKRMFVNRQIKSKPKHSKPTPPADPVCVPFSGYTEAPDTEGVLFRFLLPGGTVISASACVDSLASQQSTLLRVEALDGGSEFSFPLEAGMQSLPLSIPCTQNTRIAVTTRDRDIRGVWISFVVQLNGQI